MDKFKMISAVTVGAVVIYFQKYAVLYGFVAAAVIFDFITGMIAAVIEGTGLSSKIARKGFLRKMILFIAVAFGTFLDVFMPFAATNVGINYPGTLIFSSIIGVYICITESISIVENICRCTNSAMPEWIVKLLKQAKEKVEKKEEENNG